MAAALEEVHNLGAIFDGVAPRDAPWLTDFAEDGSATAYTYGDLADMTNALARGLLARGLEPGTRIALIAGNSARYLIAYFGIMRAGLCPVLVNWKLPGDAIAHIHRDSGVDLALADAGHAGRVPEGVPCLRLDGPDWEALLDPGPFAPPRMDARAAANILYTSGSTGMPKGVPLTHRGYGYAVAAAVAGIGRPWHATLLVAAPLYHMNGLFFAKVAAMSGAHVVLMRRFEARAYLQAIERHRIDVVTAIPTMIMLALRETDLLARLDLSSVETVMIGSSPVTEGLAARIARVFDDPKLVITYGTTESGPTAFAAHPDGRPTPPPSLGVASPHAEVRLVGGPSEDEGVLWVRSPVVMPGYLNLPEKTAERLQDGWYNTGDVMRRDAEGFYYFVDRADDMFVCGGENIHPGDVEAMLMRHPDIAEVCVVPVPDSIKGMLPAAFVVRRPGAALDAAAVKSFALENGPAYAHPRFVEFVEALPWQGTNKVDRRQLRERAAAWSRDLHNSQGEATG